MLWVVHRHTASKQKKNYRHTARPRARKYLYDASFNWTRLFWARYRRQLRPRAACCATRPVERHSGSPQLRKSSQPLALEVCAALFSRQVCVVLERAFSEKNKALQMCRSMQLWVASHCSLRSFWVRASDIISKQQQRRQCGSEREVRIKELKTRVPVQPK